MKSIFKKLPPTLLFFGAAFSANAQSYQLNLQRGGSGDDPGGSGGALSTLSQQVASAAHEATVNGLGGSDTFWNEYQLDDEDPPNNAPGVLIFDPSPMANNVLLDSIDGTDSGVTFRYSEGISNVDFSLGFSTPGNMAQGVGGAEDTSNAGDVGSDANNLYTTLWFTRIGDGGQGFQFSGLEAAEYEVYVYSTESTATARSYNVTFQTDSDDVSSQADGVPNGIAAGNNTTAFEDGVNFTKQRVLVNVGENLVVFVSAEQDGSESFSSVAAIQIVRLPFIDTDVDGLPDDYEMAQEGIDDLTSLDGTLLAGSGPGAGTGDFDGDGLSDLGEFQNSTIPTNEDSDGDTILDGPEVNGDNNPYQTNVPGDAATTAPGLATNPLVADSDNDGIRDDEELSAGDDGFITNPNTGDTDGDTLSDVYETTEFELEPGGAVTTLDPTDATGDNGQAGDPDMDTLANDAERDLGTNPLEDDTDDDGFTDQVETNDNIFDSSLDTGTDPLDSDSDNDGLKDGDERFFEVFEFDPANPPYNSDPNEPDSDSDGFSDGVEVLLGGTNPFSDAPEDIPFFAPVEATVQFDFEGPDPLSPNDRPQALFAPNPADGDILTPAHDAGFLGDTDITFNSIDDNTKGSILASDGTPAPSISIDVGITTVTTPVPAEPFTNVIDTYSFDSTLEITGENSGVAIYGTALWTDYLFSRENNNVAIRVNGLIAGDYQVIASLRQAGAPTRTFNVSFGTQPAGAAEDLPATDPNAPVLGAPIIGTGPNPASPTFVAGSNFYSQQVTITTDNDYIVVVIDPTNEAFAQINGLQIFPAPEVIGDVIITSTAFTDPNTFVINFTGDSETEYSLTESLDLTSGFNEPAGGPVTTTTALDGTGTFTVPVDTTANQKLFFRVGN